MPSWIEFWSIFDPNMAPTWSSKSTKIHEKSMPRGLPKLSTFFKIILMDFWCQLQLPEPSKSLFFLRKNTIFFKKSLFEVGIDFCSILVPTCLHFPPKIKQHPSKNRSQDASIFRSIFASIFLRFCFDFGRQLGAMLATFSLKTWRLRTSRGWFMLGRSSFSIFWAPWPPLGAL